MPAEGRDPRIDAMLSRDRMGAMAFVAALWLAILFVLYVAWQVVDDQTIRIVLTIAGALLLLFNTASIWAMLSHYEEDKDFIYGLDLKYLDEMKKR